MTIERLQVSEVLMMQKLKKSSQGLNFDLSRLCPIYYYYYHYYDLFMHILGGGGGWSIP